MKLTNIGTSKGLPKYVAIPILIQLLTLSIPEYIFSTFGFNWSVISHDFTLPKFILYFIQTTLYKNNVLLFWLISPLTISMVSLLFLYKINFSEHRDYISRWESRCLNKKSKKDFTLIFSSLIFILIYFGNLLIAHPEPSLMGVYNPMENLISMAIIHGGSICLLIPISISVLITEFRVNLFHEKSF